MSNSPISDPPTLGPPIALRLGIRGSEKVDLGFPDVVIEDTAGLEEPVPAYVDAVAWRDEGMSSGGRVTRRAVPTFVISWGARRDRQDSGGSGGPSSSVVSWRPWAIAASVRSGADLRFMASYAAKAAQGAESCEGPPDVEVREDRG